MTGGTGSTVLAQDEQAPGTARSFVTRALSGAPEEAREVARLLVSELVTNAVVHAASSVELEVEAADGAAVIRVRDADTGPLTSRGGASELDEGGRGFLLVDRLADAWGTEHQGGRKTVWFRLRWAEADPADEAALPEPAVEAEGTRRAARLLRTLVLRPTLAAVMTFDEHVSELLHRIVDASGARGAAVRIGDGERVTHGRGDLSGPVTWSRELIVGEQEHGALFVHGNAASTTDRDEDEAFFGLAADRLALLVAEHGELFAAQSRATEQDFLSEATDLLAGSSSVFLSLTLLTQIVVPRLADWCAVLSVDERRRARRVTANHRVEERTDAVNEALTADRDLRQAIRDAAHGRPAHRLPSTVSIAGQRTQVVVLPLSSRARTLGVLVLGRAEAMDPMLFMATLELARRAAVAVDNARLHEEQAETAAALQKSLLPSALPVIDGIELAARYHSASPGMEVGGDFYDAVSLADGSTVFAIGDVCGKGAEAATVTGTSRDLLRLLAQDGVAPAQALRRLNQALLDHPSSTRFCTIALAQMRRDGDRVQARVCLAGHPEPVLLKADGTTELVGRPGDLLGVLSDDHLDLTEVETELAAGDSLVLYTDGITERREGTRMYGQRGLRKTLERSAGLNAERLAEAVESAAASFVDSELRDDLAILVIRRPS